MTQVDFAKEFENTIRLITPLFPSAEKLIKPTLFHSIRVGTYLYNRNYSREICLAALLHDTLEDTPFSEEEIMQRYGVEITGLVVANTKNENIDKPQRREESIKRCAEHSEAALIIKAADIRDNFLYFSRIGAIDETNLTRASAGFVFQYKPDSYMDPIFSELDKVIK
jgi:hypothetical protein